MQTLPLLRHSQTFEFRIQDCKALVTVGEYPNGAPAEIDIRVAKQGSTLHGLMEALGRTMSIGLQHGVPLSTFINEFTDARFEPSGYTDDDEIKKAGSLLDFISRKLALEYPQAPQRPLGGFQGLAAA